MSRGCPQAERRTTPYGFRLGHDVRVGEFRILVRGAHVPFSWQRVTRGVARSAAKEPEDAWLGDLAAIQQVLPPGSRWTHLTGARIRGWWLPPLPQGLPHLAAGTHQVRRIGVHHITRGKHVDAEQIRGLRVDPPIEILLACAADLGELDLLCLTVSALVARDCTPAELDEAAARRGVRGIRTLRRILLRASDQPESIWEVLLAELHRSCGIAVEPQHTVHNPTTGAFVARGDLWLVGTKVLHEYDGAGHRAADQHARDLDRDRRLDEATWKRHGYVSRDVLHGAVRVLADADRAIGRPHHPKRIHAWWALLRGSLFTPQARHALLARRPGWQAAPSSRLQKEQPGAA